MDKDDIKTIKIYGPIYSLCGYGRRTREIFFNLLHSDYDVTVSPIRYLLYSDATLFDQHVIDTIDKHVGTPDKPYCALYICPPPAISSDNGAAAHVVAFMSQGIDTIPAQWTYIANQLNGVMAISNHDKAIFNKAGVQNVEVLHGTREQISEHYDKKSITVINELLNQYADAFKFLTVGRFQQETNDQKGIEQTIRVFLKTFQKRKNVVLFVKTCLQNLSYPDYHDTDRWFNDTITKELENLSITKQNAPKIVLLHGEMDIDALELLYMSCDAYLSLHKGTPWGYDIFDAASAGLPIITTGWGGHTDYLDDKTAALVKYNFQKIDQQTNIAVFDESDAKRLMSRWVDSKDSIKIGLERAATLKNIVNKHHNDVGIVVSRTTSIIDKFLNKKSIIMTG